MTPGMPFWRGEPPVLASASSARRALLEGTGIPFDVKAAEIDERAVENAASPQTPSAAAVLLARAKAKHVAATLPGRLVIGADQTLSLGARRFSKPANGEAAADQLRALSGHMHELHSAICVAQGEDVLFEHVGIARMHVRPLSEAFVAAYLKEAGSSVTTSVGAYRLEGLGVHLFEKVEGDHATVLGLPLLPLLDFFRRSGRLLA